MKLHQRIQLLLALRDSSLSDMLKACNISRQCYSTWKQGIRNPRPHALQRMADYLNVTYKELSGSAINIDDMSADTKEKVLIDLYRGCTDDQKDVLLSAALELISLKKGLFYEKGEKSN